LVGQHAADLRLEHLPIVKLAARGDVEQLVVGNAAPQEEREPRRELEVAHSVGGPRGHVGRIVLETEEELRAREQTLERDLNTALESALGASPFVEQQQALEILFRVGTAVRPARERRQNLDRAAELGGGVRVRRLVGMADEDATARR